MAVHACNPRTQAWRQEERHGFGASLVYTEHFKLACVTEQDPVSENREKVRERKSKKI